MTFTESPTVLRGMGFEPMRFDTTDLETVSLTTRTSTQFLKEHSAPPPGIFEEKYQTDTLSGNRTRVMGVENPHSTTEL